MELSNNFLNVTQSFFNPNIIAKISSAIGQSSESTKNGLKSVIPAFMSGMVEKGSTPEGASRLVEMVNTHKYEEELAPDESKIGQGNEVVDNIFGSNLNNVLSKLGESTGMGSGSIKKIMSMIAPVFMGVLGSKVKNEKLNPAGLTNFLKQQKNLVSGLSSAGLSGLSGIDGVKESVAKSGAFTPNMAKTLPWGKLALAALIILGLLFWWLGAQQKVTTPIVTTSVPAAQTAVAASSLDNLNDFLARANASDVPKHFSFSNLNFSTGTTVLAAGATAELDQIAASMKQHPQATARLEGYTDNVGIAETNFKLSEQRAIAVKDQLVARGIEENRISTAGLGAQNPIASNATADGRAKNRRIEFVVTKIK